MKYKSIKLYKTTFCGDCFLADRFFAENNIIVNETINIDEDVNAAAIVLEINGGYRSVPIIIIDRQDDTQEILVEPSWKQLEEAFK
ncbi:MAG: glutaredoxin family protein [Candidatus Dojkabacteria bacterium]